jgi:hypothetical protein
MRRPRARLSAFVYGPGRSETIKEGGPRIGRAAKSGSDFEGFTARMVLAWFHVLLVDAEQLDFGTVFLAHRSSGWIKQPESSGIFVSDLHHACPLRLVNQITL